MNTLLMLNSIIILFIIALVYLFIYIQERKRYIAFWTAGWFIYLLTSLIDYLNYMNLPLALLNPGYRVGPLIVSYLLLMGTLNYFGLPIRRLWKYSFVLVVSFVIISMGIGLPLFIINLLVCVLGGTYLIICGTSYVRYQAKGLERNIIGWAFILLGILLMNYPFVDSKITWFLFWGYLIKFIIECLIASGLLLSYYKKMQSVLRGSEKRFRDIADNSQDAIYEINLNPSFKVRYISKASTDISGYAPGEFYKNPNLIYRIIHPEELSYLKRLLNNPQLVGIPIGLRWIRKDGRVIWVEHNNSLIYDNNGQIIGASGIAREVTERKKNEITFFNALEVSQRRREEMPNIINEAELPFIHGDYTKEAEKLFQICKELLGVTIGFVAKIDDNENSFEIIHLRDGNKVISEPIKMETGVIFEEIFSEAKPIYENNFPKSKWSELLPKGHLPIDNILFVPLFLKNKPAGMLVLANKPGGFNEYDAGTAFQLGKDMVVDVYTTSLLRMLKEREAQITSIAHSVNDAVVTIDSKNNIMFLNKTAENIFGYSASEVLGMTIEKIIPGWYLDKVAKGVFEEVGLKKDDSEFPIEILISTWIRNNSTYRTLVIRDITERKEYEKTIKHYQMLFENSRDSMFLVGDGGRILEANYAAAKTYGYSREELLTMNINDLRVKAISYTEIKSLISKDQLQVFQHRRKDGTTFPVEVSLQKATLNNGEVDLDIVRDITERKQAEEELALEKERLAVTLRSIKDGVITTDSQGKVIISNKAAGTILGQPKEIINNSIYNIFTFLSDNYAQECKQCFNEVITTGLSKDVNNIKVSTADNMKKAITISCFPIYDIGSKITGAVLVLRDVTDEQRLQQEMLKASKLESLSVMAGGVAHDFNNLLTGVMGNIQLLTLYNKSNNEELEALLELKKAVRQAKGLTRQLLTFAKGYEPIKKVISIDDLIKEATEFAIRGSAVACKYSFPKDLWPVEVDNSQIYQVINNIVLNAKQAMSNKGEIKIVCENVSINKDHFVAIKAEKYVKISITDHGIGINRKDIQKVFDPFFTTKPEGSGLGLATCYSVIRKHNGHIEVESENDNWTTFNIYLPATLDKSANNESDDGMVIKGSGRVLIMDDELLVRKVAGRIIKYLGYYVDYAQDGEEAITKYEKAISSGNTFDVVIMDLTIPGGMGGIETIKHLINIDPNVKAVVSSGYSTDPVMAEYKKYGFSAVVSKPYSIEELSKTMKEVINTDTKL
ncbi:MAG: PAS domain S-box protein [Firmicutes bacterium]|nr:PAS domain S-box protein [Bacillota bacterium]